MFLEKTIARNKALIDAALEFRKENKITPDTYVIDLDVVENNARLLVEEAKKQGIQLYFMTKQIGRNPEIAKRVVAQGIDRIVAVDAWEALALAGEGMQLGHVGHLVQIPEGMIAEVLSYRPEVITVFSLEKARSISREAKKMGITQKLLMRVVGDKDHLYDGQKGGFLEHEWLSSAKAIHEMSNVSLAGLTAFPCFLYKEGEVVATENVKTVQKAAALIQEHLGIKLEQINLPSANSVHTLDLVAKAGGTHAEPGHALTGTTPLHAVMDLPEKPAMVYITEISHYVDQSAYVYGGGFYQRSGVNKALVVRECDLSKSNIVAAKEPSPLMIDYYAEVDVANIESQIGDAVIYAFRTQIFMTRSNVALIEGIQSGAPKLIGIYDALGRKKD
ncbi:alanine racemase [Fusibacter ferrireducens]|uniref:Alanine racemase n=1 Tax=Fusibacter ferrireducens TaxID=2785058 RepID=A0ABR9ZXM4_9FIRM|nr:alanine racemase [Fusibacter ferrireducens]MBF4695212.1 alanine racemase [Fusibacter ferrireducens]